MREVSTPEQTGLVTDAHCGDLPDYRDEMDLAEETSNNKSAKSPGQVRNCDTATHASHITEGHELSPYYYV